MNEVNSKIEKIQKTSRVVLMIANIAKVLVLVAAAACLFAGGMAIVFESEMERGIIEMLEQGGPWASELRQGGGMREDVLAAIIQNGHAVEVFFSYMLTSGAMLAAMAVMFHFIGKIFKDFREGYSPFQPKLVKELKAVFVLIAVFMLKSSLLLGLLVSLALWCVIQIFDYGCELQRESDETL